MPSTNTRLTDQEIVDQVFTERDLRMDVHFTIARLARHQGLIDRVANGLTVAIERLLLRQFLRNVGGFVHGGTVETLLRVTEANDVRLA